MRVYKEAQLRACDIEWLVRNLRASGAVHIRNHMSIVDAADLLTMDRYVQRHEQERGIGERVCGTVVKREAYPRPDSVPCCSLPNPERGSNESKQEDEMENNTAESKNDGMPFSLTERREFRMQIDPDLGAKLLELRHPRQRTITRMNLEEKIEILESGDWVCMPWQIAFDERGFLVNGQHSLTAQQKTGVSFRCGVATMLTDSEVGVLDKSRVRRHHQSIALTKGVVLRARGEAAVKALLGLRDEGIGDVSLNFIRKRSQAEIEEGLDRYKDELLWALEFPKNYAPVGVVAALAYAYPAKPKLVREFGEQLYGELMHTNKHGLTASHPAKYLAHWLTLNRGHLSGTQIMTVTAYRTLYCIKAAVRGESVSRVDRRSLRNGLEYFAKLRIRQGIDEPLTEE